jgi:ABC-type multidrug transport system fused ATPase/permease subunit
LTAAAFTLAAPLPLKVIIDNVLLGANSGFSPLDALSREMQIGALALAAALIAVAAASASAAEKIASARLRELMTRDLRAASLDHILGLSVLQRHTDRSGELVLRLIDDTGHIARLFCKTFPTIFRYAITVLLTLAAMWWLSGALGALGLVIGLALVWQMRRAAPKLQEASRAKRKLEGGIAGFAQEVLRGLGFVQSVSGEDEVRSRFVDVNAASTAAGVNETRTQVALERSMQNASGLAVAVLVGLGALLVLRGQLSLGALTVCLAYLNQLLKPVEKINELAGAVTGALARADRLSDLLERPTGLTVNPDAAAPARVRGELRLHGCSFAHRSPGAGVQTALWDAELVVRDGECVVIEGPSGAGKSTLLGLILRLYDPENGELSLSGRAYRDWPVHELRRQFAVMRQETHLFAGTIRDALQFGLGARSDADLLRVLSRVALGDLVADAPAGLDTPLGEDAGNLSGGQRARLALARALLAQRPVLLLDEPFANIDPESRAVLIDALGEERGVRTMLIVTHQSLPPGFADRTLRLEAGRLTEEVPTLLRVAP